MDVRQYISKAIPHWDIMAHLGYRWVTRQDLFEDDKLWSARLLQLGLGIPNSSQGRSPQGVAIRVMHHSYICNTVACRPPDSYGSCLHAAYTSPSSKARHCISSDEFRIISRIYPAAVSLTRASRQLLMLIANHKENAAQTTQHPTILCSFITEPPVSMVEIEFFRSRSITVTNESGVTIQDVHQVIVASLERPLLVSELQDILHDTKMESCDRSLSCHTLWRLLEAINWKCQDIILRSQGGLSILWGEKVEKDGSPTLSGRSTTSG
jgi:hypothetical protein